MEHQLDDAVVLQRRQSDDLRCGGHDDPGDRAGQDFFDVHWRCITLASTLAFLAFKQCDPVAMFVKP